jgi:hypothetical protein
LLRLSGQEGEEKEEGEEEEEEEEEEDWLLLDQVATSSHLVKMIVKIVKNSFKNWLKMCSKFCLNSNAVRGRRRRRLVAYRPGATLYQLVKIADTFREIAASQQIYTF